jgi:hypothetical protein
MVRNVKKISLLGAAVAVAVFVGVATVPTYASTYDASTNTITAVAGPTTNGGGAYGLDGTDGAALVADTNTELTVQGNIDDIRQTLVTLSEYISPTGGGSAGAGSTALATKLNGIRTLNLAIVGNATITAADVSYINHLIENIAGITTASSVTVNVTATGALTYDDSVRAGARYTIGTVPASSLAPSKTGVF